MRRLVALFAVLLGVLSGTLCRAGELSRQSFSSPVLNRNFGYLLYLPDGYQGSKLSYPVLYLLHGADGDEAVFAERSIKARIDRLIQIGAIPPAIIVMPGCAASWWIDGAKDKAEQAFWTDLVPYIDSHYRTIASREGRLIAGVSAGGYGATRFGLKYPDQVIAVAAFSPAVYAVTPPVLSAARRQSPFVRSDGQFNQALWSAANYPRLVDHYFDQSRQVAFYLVSGDSDKLGIAFETALLFKTLFDQQPELAELRIVDGGHDWAVWDQTMDDALKYLFSFTPRTQTGSH